MARSRGRGRQGSREYSLEELATAADMTVRNVRSYQTRGLIPAPRRQGRRSVYSEAHLLRLRHIKAARDRGASLNLIASHLADGGSLHDDGLGRRWLAAPPRIPADPPRIPADPPRIPADPPRIPADRPDALVPVQQLLNGHAGDAGVQHVVTRLAALGVVHQDGRRLLADPRLADGLSSSAAAGLPVTSTLDVLASAVTAGRAVVVAIDAAVAQEADPVTSRAALLQIACSTMSVLVEESSST